MTNVRKFAFYAKSPDIINELEKVPGRQISKRLSELLIKGLEFERKYEVKLAYDNYANQISKDDTSEDSKDNMLMSASLFNDEDEIEDWF